MQPKYKHMHQQNKHDDFSKVNRENFRAWNEEMIDRYDPDMYHTRSNFLITIIIRLLVNQIVKFIDIKSGSRVLEVGCGAGNVLERLYSAGAVFFGLDLSERLLQKARVRCEDTVALTAGNAEQIPFKADSFDRIICTEVIEHLLDPEACLKEIVRIAGKNTIVVITTTNESFVNRVKSVVWRTGLVKIFFPGGGYLPDRKMDDEWHIHAFDPPGFKKMLNQYLKVEKFVYVPSRFFPIQMIARCSKKQV